MMDTKICKKCGRELPLREFAKNKGTKDGHLNVCKECQKQYMKQYYQSNKEVIIEKQKQYDKERKEEKAEYNKQYYQDNKEKMIEQQKQYYQDNKEVILEQKKQYYQEHKEEHAEWGKQYHKKNRDKILERQKQYYKTPMGRASILVGSYKQNDEKYNRGECTLTAQWIVDNIFPKPCHWCGETDWHKLGCDRIDNDKPHTPDNVNPCCDKCNKKRGNKTYEEFLEIIKAPVTYV